MEQLAGALGGELSISLDINDTSAPHPRFSQYKARTRQTDQEKRRQECLRRQKELRQDAIAANRDLPADCACESDDDLQAQGSAEAATSLPASDASVQEQPAQVKCQDSGAGKSGEKSKKGTKVLEFRNLLMLSEWLVDLPVNFAEDWVMKVCPVGKRCLVVAGKGITCAYNRAGRRLGMFHSLLPGGSKKSFSGNSQFTVLDCVYVDARRLYCILDVIWWHGMDVQHTESACRFFCIKSLIMETEGLAERSPINPYVFIYAPSIACDSESLHLAVSDAPELQVDGLLFYHKEASYEAGRSPLVCWLRPSMLSDIIGVTPTEAFLGNCIPDESCIAFKKSSRKKDDEMDVTKS